MTESEWNTCTDPQVMLKWLQSNQKLSDRKARLFSVAVCRHIWPLLTDERSRRAVEVAERQADGLADAEECKAASVAGTHAWRDIRDRRARGRARGLPIPEFLTRAATAAYMAVCDGPPDATGDAQGVAAAFSLIAMNDESWLGMKGITSSVCPNLLRDIVNPFHTTPFAPAWRTPHALALATSIYELRSFERMRELGRALQDAGCTDAELLQHLSGPGPFVRGDWALDFVLGRG